MQPKNRINEVKKILESIAFSPIFVTPAELEDRLGKGDPFFEEIIGKIEKKYLEIFIKSTNTHGHPIIPSLR